MVELYENCYVFSAGAPDSRDSGPADPLAAMADQAEQTSLAHNEEEPIDVTSKADGFHVCQVPTVVVEQAQILNVDL